MRTPRHRVRSYRTDTLELAAAAWVDRYDDAPLEEQFRQTAREIAKALGYRCWHQRDSRGSDVGWPDEVWARPPRLIFAELKAPDGLVSEEQRDALEVLARCDVEAYVLRSSGDRARDRAMVADLLRPRARPARIVPRGKEITE